MADDDRRVEARLDLGGRGLSATPERIGELERQAAQIEKQTRAKPAKTFDKVMAERGGAPPPVVSAKEKKRRALPKQGPRLGLRHPAQRAAYGRDDDSQDPVVIKG
ncbi:MAG: hypothetical protein HY903_15060 [Deltaproteobacteria bacterium]|nr:hypothetical protein [Deltaproteobacteria bacterium]